MKCYPTGWRDHFFWGVWLAITIQLGLLKKVDSCSTFDTLCRLWIYEVFYAEQLIESPEKVHCLLIVNDLPTTNGKISYIEISRNSQQSILIPTTLMNTDDGIKYCSKAGVILVNMDCRTHIDHRLMENSTRNYSHAWYCYILRLVKYCADNKIPVILCKPTAAEDNIMERCIQNIIEVIRPQQNPITVKGRPENITISSR